MIIIYSYISKTIIVVCVNQFKYLRSAWPSEKMHV